MLDQDKIVHCNIIRKDISRDKYVLHLTSDTGDGTSYTLNKQAYKELYKTMLRTEINNRVDILHERINKYLELDKQLC